MCPINIILAIVVVYLAIIICSNRDSMTASKKKSSNTMASNILAELTQGANQVGNKIRSKIEKVRKKKTEKLTHKGGVVVFFASESCPYSRALNPIWEEFKKKYGEDKSIKVDVKMNPELGDYARLKYGMKGTPHVIKMTADSYKIFNLPRTVDNLYQFATS